MSGRFYRSGASTLCCLLLACGSDDNNAQGHELDAAVNVEESRGDAMAASDAQADAEIPVGMWSCVGQPDPRAATGASGSYELTINDALGEKIPAGLVAQLCGSANDPDCKNPPAGATVAIDQASAKVKVDGLPEGTLVHLQLTAPNYISAEFFSTQPVRGNTVEPVITLMFPKTLIPLIEGGARVTWDQEHNGLIAARTIDCSPTPSPGVSVSVEPSAGTKTAYLDKSGQTVDLALTATSVAGGLLIANAPGGVDTTVKATANGAEVASFVVTARAGWLTHLNLHPSREAQ